MNMAGVGGGAFGRLAAATTSRRTRSIWLALALMVAVSALCAPQALAGPSSSTHATPGSLPAGVSRLCYALDYHCTGGGYSAASAKSSGWPWSQYGGSNASYNAAGPHNCTLYAAYRLAKNGAANPGLLGNANTWDTRAPASKVNQSPAVGSIAQWNGGSFGHVAYVETVTSSYIEVTDDNYYTGNGGYTDRFRIARSSAAWPDNFIHLADRPSSGGGGGSSSGSVQFAIATADGGLWHTIRSSNGSWQKRGDLRAKLGLHSPITSLAAAPGGGGSVQFAIATADGGLWHTIRYSNGSWQSKGDLRAKLGISSKVTALAAGAGSGGSVQFAIATADGGLWHTIRSSNGSWQKRGDLRAKLGLHSPITSLAAAPGGGGSVQFAIATADGGLWHTIRYSNGSWQSKGDLRAKLGISSKVTALSAGDM